ncbi:hypothetical protein [Limisalsivibrio acetivorans]|uniref:hypothetical protein n=1 Tax=Limisalsivibrio acetivorans TaxID=1304888 RepID=UPI0003B49172|nr:hypothetical protein [Limisalsivibrio acetivorans]
MKPNTLIFYESIEERDRWLHTLEEKAENVRIGIVTNHLPLVGNLSVFENVILPSSYHFGLSQKEGRKMIDSDLRRLGIEHTLDHRPDQLDDYQRFLVKYLQVRYLRPSWIIIISPRRMYAAEYEDRFREFLRCEELDNAVIIDHVSHRELFDELLQYKESGFDEWLKVNLGT